MAEDQARPDQAGKVRHVAPTIIIGLGGTGKEVLLRLRRRFYERYNIFGFPTIAYLWVDTDTRNRNIDGQPLNHIMEQVMFRDDERVNAEVSGDAFMGYFGDQRVHPHIFSWLDPKLAAQGQVINGAGQVRPLGRLAYFHSYGDIRGKLDKALAKVRAKSAVDEMHDRHKIIVDATLLDVVLVCSVAGGTGSGMFLDMAFTCRQSLPGPDITGYLMLPSVFTDAVKGNEKIFANAYAALKELEYHSVRKDLLTQEGKERGISNRLTGSSRHDFTADWQNMKRNAGIEPAPIPPPPFNTCYLVDNRTQGTGAIGPKDKSHLCDMVAENVFLNFSSEEFSRTKDSVRANLEQFLGNPLIYRYDEEGPQGGYLEVFAQRFSTFGFSKLYVPVDRVRRACGYQLGLDIILRWLERNELSDIQIEQQLLERELANLGLRSGSGGDNIVSELRRVGERSFDDEIRDEVNRWREILLQHVNTEKRPQLYSVIPKLLKEFLNKNFDKTDARPENWGAFIKTLEQNRDRLVKYLCGEFDLSGRRQTDGSILSRVKLWLKDDYIRLYLAVEYLKMLGKIYNRNVEEAYANAKQSADRRAESAAEEIKIKLEMARDEESGVIVQRKSLRVLVEQICDRLRDHLSARIQSFVMSAAVEVVNNRLQPYIGKEEIREDAMGRQVTERAGLILELWSLRDDLAELHAQLKTRLEAFEKVEEQMINENLYQAGMFHNYYKIQRPEGLYPVDTKLDELENLLLQNLQTSTPYNLRDLIRERGRERVLNMIEDFCYRQFQELEVSVDALEIFEQRYQSRELREQRLQRFVNNGSVWLPKSRQAENYRQLTQNRADSVVISVSAAMRDKHRKVYEEIESRLKAAEYKNFSYSTTSWADAIFIYTEYAGLPLAYVRDLDYYFREAYLPLIRQAVPLHIEVQDEKFGDLLIKNYEEIERTLRANRALLVGAILRIVTVNTDGKGNAIFAFSSYQEGLGRTQPLGMKSVAIETLKREPQLLASIEKEINARRLARKGEPQLRFYTLLAYHILDHNNPYGFPAGPFARGHQASSQGMSAFFSPEWKALEETRVEAHKTLEAQLGSPGAVDEGFKAFYQEMDNFSQEIVIEQRQLRILKDGS